MNNRGNFDHYVAQHYIKLFTDASGYGYIGSVLTHNVDRSDDFTRVLGRQNWSVDQDVEDMFTAIEDRIASALARLNAAPIDIRGFAQGTREAIRDFIVLHSARTVGIHDFMNQSTEQFKQELIRKAPSGFDVTKLGLRDATRPESLLMGFKIGAAIEAALSIKGCVALACPDGKNFILGDNPLVNLTSQRQELYRGALPDRDTYLWFPLNPKLGLIFIDGVSNTLIQGPLKLIKAGSRLVDILNDAEVFLATENVIGSLKRTIVAKVKKPNVGKQRARVTTADWHPIAFLINDAVYPISQRQVSTIRNQIR